MHEITQQYQKKQEKHDACCLKIDSLIRELLNIESIKYHKIESRVKSISSLDRKIYAKDEKYQSINDITDLVALRIITYFEDEVENVAQIIKDEFIIDPENSSDKRQLAPDTFGYCSLHYVVSIDAKRHKLKEYKRFKDLRLKFKSDQFYNTLGLK